MKREQCHLCQGRGRVTREKWPPNKTLVTLAPLEDPPRLLEIETEVRECPECDGLGWVTGQKVDGKDLKDG